jgi:hypothetical protein
VTTRPELYRRCPLCGARRGEYCRTPSRWLYQNGYRSHVARYERTLYFNSASQVDRQAANRALTLPS